MVKPKTQETALNPKPLRLKDIGVEADGRGLSEAGRNMKRSGNMEEMLSDKKRCRQQLQQEQQQRSHISYTQGIRGMAWVSRLGRFPYEVRRSKCLNPWILRATAPDPSQHHTKEGGSQVNFWLAVE